MERSRTHSQTPSESYPTQWISPDSSTIGPKPVPASKCNDNDTRYQARKIPMVTMSLFKEMAIAIADEMFRKNPTANLESSAWEAEFAMRRLRTVFSDSGAPGLPKRRAARLPFDLTLDRFAILPNAVEMACLSPEVTELARKNLGWSEQGQKTLLLDSVIEGLNEAIRKGKLSAVGDGTILVSLSEELVVKIGLYDMLDDISMLQYIKENAPQVPLPVTHAVSERWTCR
ncbi:hypothetical protein ACJ72_07776 [Emergomyces africanus]|uniref:Uncharacterized protein n=1 Tax=Emergomyces africanus TaxID=1955775 RepID=A0A1B7NMB9_9EURO|nr:hypothetical protein ACJ72_07776 [Emergomyces africanus]